MLAEYVLKKEDYEAVEEGIEIAYGEKMSCVFPRGLGGVDLVTYDAKFIYLWSRRNYKNLKRFRDSVCRFNIYRFPHKLKLVDDDYDKMALTAGGIGIGGKIFKDLPSSLNIQCAPLAARAKLRAKKYKTPAEETSYEEAYYRAIIAHEFGHCYFDQTNQHPFPRNLLNLTKSSSGKISKAKLADLVDPPNLDFLSELFATLVELEVFKDFYPAFLEKVIGETNLYVKKRLALDPQEVDMLLAKDDHFYAKILAPCVFRSFPNWPTLKAFDTLGSRSD